MLIGGPKSAAIGPQPLNEAERKLFEGFIDQAEKEGRFKGIAFLYVHALTHCVLLSTGYNFRFSYQQLILID